MIRNRCNIFCVDTGIHPKNEGKNLCIMHFAHDADFPLRFWGGYFHQPQKYYNDSLIPCAVGLQGNYFFIFADFKLQFSIAINLLWISIVFS